MAGEPPDPFRMESDHSIDWNLEEYSFQDNSNNKVNWALRKGCSVGKKILVTGFVLSSAPVVLPSLAVISAFGFAVSIPYGVFLASYACTEMIMSMLLPNPLPPLLEYQSEITNEALYLEEEFGDYKDHLELNYGQVSVEDKEKGFEHFDEMVEENGYEEDIDEYVGDEQMIEKQENDELLDNLQVDVVVVKGDEENKIDDESREETIEVTTLVFEENDGRERAEDIRDEEEFLKETKGLLEKIRDEGIADDNIPVANDGEVEEISIREVNNGNEVIQEVEIVTRDVKPIGEEKTSVNTLGTALSENPIHDGKEDNIRIKNIDVFQSDDKKRMLVVSHEDGREIADESGFDLLDKANNSAAQYPHADHETTEGFSNSKDDGTPGLAELPSLVVIDETEPADISVSAVTVDFKVEAKAPDKDHMVPSNEGFKLPSFNLINKLTVKFP